MKKCLFISFLLLTTSLLAQPVCQWGYIPVGASQTYNTIYNATTDHSGNIIEVGKILGIADMDPGSGPADTSFTSMTYNYYISKTSITGQLLWIHYFQNNSQIAFFEYTGLKVNSMNEIIVSGNYFGMIDFDLSATGTDTIRSHFPTYPDYFVAKYDSSGNYKWAFSIGNPTTSNIESKAITVLDNDHIVVSANPNGVVDVDPDSSSIHNSIGGNANLICYDSNGNYLWNNHITTLYSYSILNNSIDADANGNVYVASIGYYKLTMSKFDSLGTNLWDKTIGDFATAARVDAQSVLVEKATGNFYVAGTFGGTVDFDPGPAVVNKSSSSGFYQDGFIAKYDMNMNLLWVNAYVGKISFGNYSLDFDGSDLMAVGNLQGTIDFGNGNVLSAPASFSSFYLEFDTSGTTQQTYVLTGPGKYFTISKSVNDSYVITGNISGSTDIDPSLSMLILNTTVSTFYTAVYNNPSTTAIDEPTSQMFITAYPNPTCDVIHLNFDQSLVGTQLSIIDINGKTIANFPIENVHLKLDVQKYSNGIYLIKSEELKQSCKFIKQ